MEQTQESQETRSTRRAKHMWKPEEDEKLVEALLDMVNVGLYKVENGFKPGYSNYIESVLKETIPEANIKAKPHIESRMKILKKEFNAVHDLVTGSNTSGFGYDNQKRCVIASSDVWDAYLKVHKDAAQWKHKSFPHYDDLCIVFGKDRANGLGAQSGVDFEHDILQEEYASEMDGDEHLDDYHVDFSTFVQDDATTTRPPPSVESNSQTSKKKRARKQDSLLESITAAATLLGEKIESASTKFSKAIGVESDFADKTSKLMGIWQIYSVSLCWRGIKQRCLSQLSQKKHSSSSHFHKKKKRNG